MRAMFPSRTFEPLWTGIEEREDGRSDGELELVALALLPDVGYQYVYHKTVILVGSVR